MTAIRAMLLVVLLSLNGWASPLPKELLSQPDDMPMVLIPAGQFVMGSLDGDEDEQPVHTVFTQAFYMDVYEVTNVQYARFLNAVQRNASLIEKATYINLAASDCLIEKMHDGYRARSGYEDHPVVEVSWFGARDYAEWAGKRLPTEAEWEKASRGGLTAHRFPWGNEVDGSFANYDSDGVREWNTESMLEHLSPVGTYAPNDYGLYDMAGNVWEWCFDWYAEDSYAKATTSADGLRGPLNTTPTGMRSTRSGSWFLQARTIRCANRRGNPPDFTDFSLGFRCVKIAAP